jgi:hypothetical protein
VNYEGGKSWKWMTSADGPSDLTTIVEQRNKAVLLGYAIDPTCMTK